MLSAVVKFSSGPMADVSIFFDDGAGQILVFVRAGGGARRILAVVVANGEAERLASVFPQESRSVAAAAVRHRDWSKPFRVDVIDLRQPGSRRIASAAFDPALTLTDPSCASVTASVLAIGPLTRDGDGGSAMESIHAAHRRIAMPAGLDAAAAGAWLRSSLTRREAVRAFQPAAIFAARVGDDACGPLALVWPARHPVPVALSAGLAWRNPANGAASTAYASAIESKIGQALQPEAFFRMRGGADADAVRVFHVSLSALGLAGRLREYRRSRGRDWSYVVRRVDAHRADARYSRATRAWREVAATCGDGALEARARGVGLGDLFVVWSDPSRVRLDGVTGPPDGRAWFVAAGEHLLRLPNGHALVRKIEAGPFLIRMDQAAANLKEARRVRASRMFARLASRFASAKDPAARFAFGEFSGGAGRLASRAALAVQTRACLGDAAGPANGNGAAPPPPRLSGLLALHDAAPEIFQAGLLWGGLSEAEASHAIGADLSPLAVSILWPMGDCPAHVARWIESKTPLEQARIVRRYLDIHAAHAGADTRLAVEQTKALLEQRAEARREPGAPRP